MSAEKNKLTYYQKNSDKILQRSKEYYEDNKKQRKEYRKNRYNNMTEEEKEKAVEYRKQ